MSMTGSGFMAITLRQRVNDCTKGEGINSLP